MKSFDIKKESKELKDLRESLYLENFSQVDDDKNIRIVEEGKEKIKEIEKELVATKAKMREKYLSMGIAFMNAY